MEESSYGELPQHSGEDSSRHWLISTSRRVMAEIVGTFFLMFSACGSVMAGWDILVQALAVACSLIMVISSLSDVSGAHLNPAITLAFAATNQFQWSQVPWYFGGQFMGGMSAMSVAKLLYRADHGAALTQPGGGGWGPAFAMEVILTFGLSFLAAAMNTQQNRGSIEVSVAIGLTVAMNMLLGGEVSGASMNPIRSLAPAIVQNSYTHIWIYLLAPLIGAIMGAVSYRLLHPSFIHVK